VLAQMLRNSLLETQRRYKCTCALQSGTVGRLAQMLYEQRFVHDNLF